MLGYAIESRADSAKDAFQRRLDFFSWYKTIHTALRLADTGLNRQLGDAFVWGNRGWKYTLPGK
jgi:hypothetical protein